MDLSALLSNLFYNLFIPGAVCAILWWLAGQFPDPFSRVGRWIIAFVAAFVCINFLLGLGGHPLIRIR